MDFEIAGHGIYTVSSPATIRTPRLLVFEERVKQNIETMRALLEDAVPGSGFRHLCPHLKTNKSSRIIQMMQDAGITDFKVSVNEAELAARCGAKRVFVAYPLLEHDADRAAALAAEYRDTLFTVQAGCSEHVTLLERAARRNGVVLGVMLDIDVGMHRTGAPAEEAWTLYLSVAAASGLEFAGLHGYDGHIHFAEEAERKAASAAAMNILLSAAEQFRSRGAPVPLLTASGSPAFASDLTFLAQRVQAGTDFRVSPGTWIFWDSKYNGIIPGLFTYAALILAQVIEARHNCRVTLNLGHKRWAADQGPVEVFSPAGMKVVLFSEEHTVLEHQPEQSFGAGDYVMIVPRHICPTVNLYEYFTLIGAGGELLDPASPVDGRNR